MYTYNYTNTVAAMTTTPAEIAAANNNRNALILHNQGSADVRVYLDSNTTAFMVLASGETFKFENAPRNAVNGVTVSGTANIAVFEA